MWNALAAVRGCRARRETMTMEDGATRARKTLTGQT
jgi:hypothetical protein